MFQQRYNDYYLVNDEDMPDDGSIEYRPKKKCSLKKILIIASISLASLAVVAFFVIFVVLPLVFKDNVSLQQDLVFTRWGLLTNKTLYSIVRYPSYRNYYVEVQDLDKNATLRLGVWHILPFSIAEEAIYDKSFDFDRALKYSNQSVLLYFHGTGEDRTQNLRKYQILREFFHVIAFDYRGYGDSDNGDMFEKNIVNDCVQLYKWLKNKTKSKIYVWGHSLGTALATSTLAHLGEESNVTGLILEAAFTNFRDELYHHPMVKYFRWLPWFEYSIVQPLTKNGFIFNTSTNILNVTCPILFLHAMDDKIIPFFMSKKLYEIAQMRHVADHIKNETTLVLFDGQLGLKHYFIYQDPYTFFFVYDFLKRSFQQPEQFFKGSHQS